MALAARPGANASSLDQQRVPPNQSIYIQNLPEKIQKDDLRRELYILFSTYGPVIDVTAMKSQKMRGQAHVLFKDVQCATQALRSCQGFEFFGREMKISYSKNRSNTLAKLTGTFNQPPNAEQQRQANQPPSSFPLPPGTAKSNGPPSSFPAPPGSLPAPPSGLPPPPGLPSAPASGNGAPAVAKVTQQEAVEVSSPQGVKRPRDESDDEEAPMDEDDDKGSAMEMSDDDDDD